MILRFINVSICHFNLDFKFLDKEIKLSLGHLNVQVLCRSNEQILFQIISGKLGAHEQDTNLPQT